MDPERSDEMKKREDSVLSYLKRRKAEYSDQYKYRNNPNTWVEKYVDELTQRIDCEAGDVHLYLKDPSVNFSNQAAVVHGSRHMIALHHQKESSSYRVWICLLSHLKQMFLLHKVSGMDCF